jgi:tetratricopeptide (TPR) repeat protein
VNAQRTSTARRATSLAVAAALALGTEGQALAAMAPAAGTKGQVSASTPAPTGAPTPGDLSAQAIDRFKAKDYDAAAKLFEEAYKLDSNPNYLFNIGRVYEEKGDIRAAVDYYQRFVKEPGVELEARELALQRLRVLKAILEETDGKKEPPTDEPKDEQPPPVEGPKEPTKTQPEPPAEDPGAKKMWTAGFVLLGIGAVGMAVGGILGGVTLSKQNQLEGIHDYKARVDLAEQGRGLALGTDVLLGVGGALVLTGIILVGVSASKRRAKAVAARRVWPTGLGLAGRF